MNLRIENKTILMTGATGFLGSNLLKELLKKNLNVLVLKRSFSNTDRINSQINKIETIDLDKSNIDDVFNDHKIDTILHCATDYGRKNNDRLSIIDANLMLPLKLLELGVKHGVKQFINTDTLLDKRINYYSLSKKQFNDWLRTYANNILCVNVALEHFYGPFDDRTKFISYLIGKVLANAPSIDLTPGKQKRDFIFIDDVVAAFVKIIESFDLMDKEYHHYEIGTNEQIEIMGLALLIKELAANKTTKLNFGALPYRENEQMEIKVDTNAIRKLGWEPEFSLKEGLKKTIDAERKAMKT